MSSPAPLLPGVRLVPLRRTDDTRGSFIKTYAPDVAAQIASELGEDFQFVEEFYSVSKRNVVRGMHFQTPPHDHVKLVYCPVGAVLDVLLDLRRGPTRGRTMSVELRAADPALLVIPRGIAHGFKALHDDTVMVYKTSSAYAPAHDAGLRWDSFGFDWQLTAPPIVSARDAAHPAWPHDGDVFAAHDDCRP